MADDTTLTSFIEQFNGFLVTCNELEDNDAWDKEANGPIELYLQADLLGVVLLLPASVWLPVKVYAAPSFLTSTSKRVLLLRFAEGFLSFLLNNPIMIFSGFYS